MSAVPNAHKKGLSPAVRTPIRERGRVKSGVKPGMPFCCPIPPAPIVNPRLEYRITQLSKSMANQNILNSKIPSPYVSLVIEGSMLSGFNALSAAKLAVNPKVTSAMVACLEVIENELFTGRNTGKESGTKPTQIKESRRGRGKEDEYDRPMAWR